MGRVAFALALVALGVAMGANSLTRVRRFTPDSMVYVDAARNLAAGRGLAYDTVEMNEPGLPPEREFPVPLTTFPPLYPLAIAAVARLGPEAAEAALAVAAASWLAVLLLGYALARRAFGEAAARLAMALLVFYAPLYAASNAAWSEPLGVALFLAALWAMPALDAAALPRAGAGARVALSGLLAGLAFATRYALAPALLVGPCALSLFRRPVRRGLAEAALWSAAALVPVALVLARNYGIDGELLPSAGPSTTSAFALTGAALRALFGQALAWPAGPPWPAQAAGIALLLLAALAAAGRREGSPRAGLSALVRGAARGDAAVLLAWTVGYLVFLVVVASRRRFDAVDARLVLPAGVTGVLVAAAWLARGFRVSPRLATFLLVAALAGGAAREAALARRVAPRTTAQEIAASERLTWLARNTTPRDLILGDDTVDIAFYARRRTVSFSSYPGAAPPTLERVRAYCLAHRGEYERCFLVLSDRWPHARDWGRRFGPFFARLATGRDTTDAGLGPAVILQDAILYPYDPNAGGRTGG